jgi:hypothetical protein
MIGQLQRQHVPGYDAGQVNDPQAVEHTLEIWIEEFLLHLHLYDLHDGEHASITAILSSALHYHGYAVGAT